MAKRIAKNRKLSRKQESDKDDIINQYIIFCKVFNEQTKHRKVVWNSIKNTCGRSDADKVTKNPTPAHRKSRVLLFENPQISRCFLYHFRIWIRFAIFTINCVFVGLPRSSS